MAQSELSPEEMQRRQIARFRDLKPTKRDYQIPGVEVPAEAYEMVASKNIYLIMAPKDRARSFSQPAVVGAEGLEVSIVECPPDSGPPLHVHERTRETFMPLTGSYEVTWGKEGQHRTVLEPFDLFAVPPGEYRAFRNVSDHDAKLLVLVQGDKSDVMNDIFYPKSLAKNVTEKFGAEVWEGFSKLGLRIAED
jgi:uncharacterized RmlC-like cupin family protein